MKNKVKTGLLGTAGIGVTILLLTLSGIVGALCFPYAINTWLVFFGKAPVFLWWYGFILGYVPFVGQFAFPCAAITFILMFFI